MCHLHLTSTCFLDARKNHKSFFCTENCIKQFSCAQECEHILKWCGFKQASIPDTIRKMLPKTHIIIGMIFSAIVYFLFEISILNATLIFLASFLMDFDHYLWHYQKRKTWSLKKAYYYLNGFKKKKSTLMFFHTIEMHLLVFALGFFWNGFWFVLIGMIFHSILDIISLSYEKELKYREFSIIRYFILKKKNPTKYF